MFDSQQSMFKYSKEYGVQNDPFNSIFAAIKFIMQDKIQLKKLLETGLDKPLKEFVSTLTSNYKKSLLEKFKNGDFDAIIFSAKPKATEDLKNIIYMDNRSFMQNLFINCKNKEVFNFWLNNGAKLPSDSVGLAVALRAKKFVFEHLNNNGWFKNVGEVDKKDFLERVVNLDEDTLNYLNDIFAINKNQAIKYQFDLYLEEKYQCLSFSKFYSQNLKQRK